jgi:hypothetical protein
MMSGTDHTKAADWSPGGPVSILVEPQMGENIGAAARAMWNFGLRGLRIVNPRDGWPNPAAVAMASGAGGLLDEARIYGTTAEAVADLHVVYATTARPREMAKTVMTPERAMAHARELIGAGKRVGILYGRERTGLETRRRPRCWPAANRNRHCRRMWRGCWSIWRRSWRPQTSSGPSTRSPRWQPTCATSFAARR